MRSHSQQVVFMFHLNAGAKKFWVEGEGGVENNLLSMLSELRRVYPNVALPATETFALETSIQEERVLKPEGRSNQHAIRMRLSC